MAKTGVQTLVKEEKSATKANGKSCHDDDDDHHHLRFLPIVLGFIA